MNKYSKKIRTLMKQRGWTAYKLAQESGLYAQTIHKWFETEAVPTTQAIEQVCEAFGITMAEFFADNDLIEASPRLKELHGAWCALTADEQASVELIVRNYLTKKKSD